MQIKSILVNIYIYMCMYVCIYTYIHHINCVNRLQQTAQLVGCFIRNIYIYT